MSGDRDSRQMWVITLDGAISNLPDMNRDVMTDVKTNIPKTVNAVLNSRHTPVEAKEIFDHFLRPIVVHIANWLKSSHPIFDEVLEVLFAIFDGKGNNTQQYYKEHGRPPPKQKPPEKPKNKPGAGNRRGGGRGRGGKSGGGNDREEWQEPPAQKSKELVVDDTKQLFAQNYSVYDGASTYVLIAVNVFGENGGFDSVLRRVATAGPSQLRIFCRLLRAIRLLFIPGWGKDYVEKLHVVVLQRLLALAEANELKQPARPATAASSTAPIVISAPVEGSINKIQIDSILSDTEELIAHCIAPAEAYKTVELFRLQLALKLSGSPILERQVLGMTLVSDLVEKLKANSKPAVPLHFLDQKSMSSWLVTNKVVDRVLDAKSHHELLTRGEEILKFCADNNTLNSRHLDALWLRRMGDNPFETKIADNIIVELAHKMSIADCLYIVQHMERVKSSDYRVGLVTLIERYSLAALQNQRRREVDEKDQKWMGLPLLWKLWQSKLPEEICAAALASCHALLKHSVCESQRMAYINSGLELFKSGTTDVPKCLEILTAIFNTFQVRRAWGGGPKAAAVGAPAGASSALRADELLKLLDMEHKLVEVIVADMMRYKEVAIKQSVALKADENAVVAGRATHTDQVKTRLRFLGLVLQHSDLTLPGKEVNVLFDSLVTRALTRTERTTFLRWLAFTAQSKTCKNKRDFESFDDDTIESLFVSKICKIDTAMFDEAASACFQHYFLSIQIRSGVITRFDQHKEIESSKLASGGRKELEFKHYNELWSKLMAVPDSTPAGSTVVNQFINLIIRLHSQLSKSLRVHVRDIRQGFLTRTVASLRELLSHGGNAIQWDHVYRVLLLLERFVAGDLDRESADRVIEPKTLQVLFTIRPTMDKRKAEMSSVETVGDARLKIAGMLEHPEAYIELTNATGNVLLTTASQPLDDILGSTTQRNLSLYVVKKPPPDTVGVANSKQNEDPTSSASILSSDLTVYQLFFLLMSAPAARVQQSAWELLKLLPPAEALSNAITECKLAWKDLFSPTSSLQLLFNLNLMDGLVNGRAFENEEMKASRESWFSGFVERGGLKHLHQVFMTGLQLTGADADNAWIGVMRNRAIGSLQRYLALNENFIASVLEEKKDSKARAASIAACVSRVLQALSEATISVCGPKAPVAYSKLSSKFVADGCAPAIEGAWAYLAAIIRAYATNQPGVILQQIYNYKQLTDIVRIGVLDAPNEGIRRAMTNGVRGFAQSLSKLTFAGDILKPAVFFSRMLLELLDTAAGRSSATLQYFTLLAGLYRDAGGPTIPPPPGASGASPLPNVDSLVAANGKALLVRLTAMIAGHPILERTPQDDDEALRGLLAFVAVLLELDPSLRPTAGPALVEEIYCRCLFAESGAASPTVDALSGELVSPVKCKSQKSRSAAFGLLMQLVRDCPPTLHELMARITQSHIDSRKDGQWAVDPSENVKHGFVGLRNMGATCYINSFMQQLYMVPGLHQQMLKVRAKTDAKDFKESDSTLIQIQRVFQHLAASSERFYDPSQFCTTFKGWDGMPIDVKQQNDVYEFLNMLFQKLEVDLNGASARNLLKDNFGCVFISRKQCTVCGLLWTPMREENMVVSLSVNEQRAIQGALAQYVRGETVQLKCTNCARNTDIRRSMELAELPSTLMLHLNRFGYDVASGRKKKLNDEIAFPMKLDLYPYTAEGLAKGEKQKAELNAATATAGAGGDKKDEKSAPAPAPAQQSAPAESEASGAASGSAGEDHSQYLYELVGILMHSGHAEGGHYYSYIQDRRPGAVGDGNWWEFNDKNVRPFDPAEMPYQCFGGKEDLKIDLGANAAGKKQVEELKGMEKQHSAYVLFYQKCVPHSATAALSPAVASPAAVTTPNGSLDVKTPPVPIASAVPAVVASPAPASSPSSFALTSKMLPDYLQKAQRTIDEFNAQLLRDQLTYDAPYMKFLWDVFGHYIIHMTADQTYPVDDITKPNTNRSSGGANTAVVIAVAQASTVMFATLARAKNTSKLKDWVAALQILYSRSIPACVWFCHYMHNESEFLRTLLFECPTTEIRELIVNLIEFVVDQLVRYELDASYVPTAPLMALPNSLKDMLDREKKAAAAAAASQVVKRQAEKNANASSDAKSTPQSPAPASNSSSSATATAASTPASPSPSSLLAEGNQIFKKDAAVAGNLSVSSSVETLYGVGKAMGDKLRRANISTIMQLANINPSQRGQMENREKCSEEQMDNLVAKAVHAIELLNADAGIAPTPLLNSSSGKAAAPPTAAGSAAYSKVAEGKASSGGPASAAAAAEAADTAAAIAAVAAATANDTKETVGIVGLGANAGLPLVAATLAKLVEDYIVFGPNYSHTFIELFDLLVRFSKKSTARTLLARKGLIPVLLRLFKPFPPPAKPATAASASKDSKDSKTAAAAPAAAVEPEIDWPNILTLLSQLIRCCKLTGPKVPIPPTLFTGGMVCELSDGDRKALSSPVFLKRLVCMPMGITNDPASAIACHLAWENDAFSKALCDAITTRVSESDYYDFATALKVLSSVLSLEDSRAAMRADYVLPTYFNILEVNANYYKATDLCINFVLNVALKTAGKCTLNWLFVNRARLNWIDVWLNRNRHPPSLTKPKKGQEDMKMYKPPEPEKPPEIRNNKQNQTLYDSIVALFKSK